MGDGELPVVILAGGRGARFDHESQVTPKPLIEVAGKPILGHIMDSFEVQGFKEFWILGGYMWEKIGEYLKTRYLLSAKARDDIQVFGEAGQRPAAHLFDTGESATTGDRLMSLALELMLTRPVIVTYGDGLCDVDLKRLVDHHKSTGNGKPRITVTAVHPPGRFGVIELGAGQSSHVAAVSRFGEKPADGWINGGFMVVDNGIVPRFVPRAPFDEGPYESFESGAMVRAADQGQMSAFLHTGYWRCMDTRRDLEQIEEDVRRNGGRLPWLR